MTLKNDTVGFTIVEYSELFAHEMKIRSVQEVRELLCWYQ